MKLVLHPSVVRTNTRFRLAQSTGVSGHPEPGEPPPISEGQPDGEEDAQTGKHQECRGEVLGQQLLEERGGEEAHHAQRSDQPIGLHTDSADESDTEEREHPVLHDVDPPGIEGDLVRVHRIAPREGDLHDGAEEVGHDQGKEPHSGAERRNANKADLLHQMPPKKEHRDLIAAKDMYLYHKNYTCVKIFSADSWPSSDKRLERDPAFVYRA